MKKFAVIDVGSNSVRLLFVADGKVLYKRLNTTRLGEGIAKCPRLKDEAIARSALAVADFYGQAKKDGAEAVFAFATAAVRTAENGGAFVERIHSLCGLRVEIVSGEEEAELGILGALGKADGGVIDVGGASTEIVVRTGGECVYKKSVNVGVVRLKDLCGRDKTALTEQALRAAGQFVDLPKISSLYAIGGTATTIAAQILQLEKYDSGKITGTEISLADMENFADKLLSMTVEEIAAMPCMPKGRADVLTGGVVLLVTLMKKLRIEKLVVSDRDNLEGFAIKRGFME